MWARPLQSATSQQGQRAFPLKLFCQDLAMLLDAGIALLEALQALRDKETRPHVLVTLSGLVARLEQGTSLSSAFEADAQAFGTILPAITAASERTGQLVNALRHHADHLAWAAALRQRVLAAITYPALLLGVGSSVVIFLIAFVIPRFASVLGDLGGDLPWMSRLLLAVGLWVNAHPMAATVAGATLLALVASLARSATARGAMVAAAWRSRWLGERLRSLALARLFRTLSMLLTAGVPALTALALARGSAALPLRHTLREVEAMVADGHRLSAALNQKGLCNAVSSRMVRVGERSGTLHTMLARAADFHDEEVMRYADFVTRVLNPALMLLMGVVIGGIVVLMYLPIFQLVEQVQ